MGAYLGFTEQILTSYMAGKTMKAMFMAETYAFDEVAHGLVADVSSHEITGTGYSAGGYTVTPTIEMVGDEVRLKVANLSLENVTFDVAGAVFYLVQTGELIAHDEFAETVSVTNSDLDYIAPSGGLLVLKLV